MHLDDAQHKVYIYDLDAELSDSESSDDGRLVFLPDIEKHLRETRIPASIMANSDGELAGQNQQLILYNIPSSLSVPEEKDGVRKAIIETRARARALAKEEQNPTSGTTISQTNKMAVNGNLDGRGWNHGMNSITLPRASLDLDMNAVPAAPIADEYDPDAMDLG